MGEKVDADEDFYTAQIVGSAIDLSMSSRRTLTEASTQAKQDEAARKHKKQQTSPGGKQPDSIALDPHGKWITDSEKAPGFSTSDYRRDVHAKSHGCANGKFEVLKDVPGQFAFGLLSHPGEVYRAIVRFSSGKPHLNPDGVPDARGFAVKLLVNGQDQSPDNARPLEDFVKDEQDRDAELVQQQLPQTGAQVAQAAPPSTTQDFVMINSKVFFIRTIKEYAAFSSALGQGKPMQYFFPSPLKPWTWHAREAALAISSFKPRPESLVTEQYYSLSAYKLGPRAYVKYSFRPCAGNKPKYPSPYAKEPGFFSLLWRDIRLPAARAREFSLDPDSYRDYLRDELKQQLTEGSPCFDFLIQPQIPEKGMPIEDTTVEWSESASPFIPVGRLTLDKVPNNTTEMNQKCENLSFSPWHALPEHEPVGVMNRVRKAVYQGMSRYRREKNCQPKSGMPCPAAPAG
jgi:hypothetical protein